MLTNERLAAIRAGDEPLSHEFEALLDAAEERDRLQAELARVTAERDEAQMREAINVGSARGERDGHNDERRTAIARAEKAERELAEARAAGQKIGEAMILAQNEAAELRDEREEIARVLTSRDDIGAACTACGFMLGRDRPEWQATMLAHVRDCEKHPVGAEIRAATARADALARRVEGLVDAATHAHGVLASIGDGHDGDEESGEHEPDCRQCAVEAAAAHLDAALAAPLEAPAPEPNRFRCPACPAAPVIVDEDGCCATCGADAEPYFDAGAADAALRGGEAKAVMCDGQYMGHKTCARPAVHLDVEPDGTKWWCCGGKCCAVESGDATMEPLGTTAPLAKEPADV